MMTDSQIEEIYDKYIKDVIENKKGRHGKYEILKVKRHLSDLERDDIFFDNEEANKVVKFASAMRLSDDAHWRQKIKLRPHQVFHYRTLFGWKKIDPETGQIKRRFRRSLNTKARKNGKTQENAITTAYMFIGAGEKGAQCFTAANTREQALVTYDETKNMLEMLSQDSKKAKSLLRLMANACLIPARKCLLKAMASDPKKLDGFKPYFASLDEPHEMKTNKLLKIFERGMLQQLQPLICMSSTVGYNMSYPFYKFYRMCEKILDGILEDDSLFIDIYAMDDGDDWTDENNWYKPNPMLGEILNLDNFRADFRSSRNEGGTSEIDFKVKNLNMWSNSAQTWVDPDIVKLARSARTELTKKEITYIGVDLATNHDIAAIAAISPPQADRTKFRLRMYYFIPENTIDLRTQKDGVPYRQWANEGRFEIVKDKKTIDQKYLEKKVVEITETQQVKSIDIDRWNATQFKGNLEDEGLEVQYRGQGFRTMNEPCKILERLFIEELIDIGDDPIFEWMMSNVAIDMDPTGAMKPNKKKSSEKIDGVSAVLTAIAGYIEKQEEESIYEKSDVRRII